jgi:hypothetical protein
MPDPSWCRHPIKTRSPRIAIARTDHGGSARRRMDRRTRRRDAAELRSLEQLPVTVESWKRTRTVASDSERRLSWSRTRTKGGASPMSLLSTCARRRLGIRSSASVATHSSILLSVQPPTPLRVFDDRPEGNASFSPKSRAQAFQNLAISNSGQRLLNRDAQTWIRHRRVSHHG